MKLRNVDFTGNQLKANFKNSQVTKMFDFHGFGFSFC